MRVINSLLSMRVLLLLLFVYMVNTLSAQENIADPVQRIYQKIKIDSIYSRITYLSESGDISALKRELHKYPYENKVLYGKLSIEYLNSLGMCVNIFNQVNEPDSVLFYGNESKILIDYNKLNNSELDYGITYCLGCAYYNQGQFSLSLEKALESYEKVFKVYSSPGLSLTSSLGLIIWSAFRLNNIGIIKSYAEEFLEINNKIYDSSSKLLSTLKMINEMMPSEDASFSLWLLQKYEQRFTAQSECSKTERIEFYRMLARNYCTLKNNILAVDYIQLCITECENWDSCPHELWLEVLCESLEILSTTNLYDNMIDVANRILHDTKESKQTDNYQISALVSLGIAYGHKNMYSQSIEYLTNALNILDASGQNETILYLNTIDILSGVLIDAEEYSNCITLINSNLQKYSDKLGNQSERSIMIKERLGWAYYKLCNYNDASRYFAECGDSYRELFFKYSEYLSEIELYMLFDKYNTKFKQLCVRASNMRKKDINGASYNGALTSKSFLVTSQIAFRNTIFDTKDEDLINLYIEYEQHRKNSINYFNRDIFDSNNQGLILGQKKIISILNSKGIEYLTEFNCTWQDVQSALPDNGCAIEFTSFTFDNDSTVYYAQILNKTMEYPTVIPLFNESILVEKTSCLDYLNSSDLYDLIWSNIEPYINNCKDIYFATDGLLHTIPIEFVNRDRNIIVSDIWNMHRLSSTRELCMNRTSHKTSSNIYAYGGMTYSSDRTYESALHTNTILNRANWGYLPATLTEIKNIRDIVISNENFCTFLTGCDGTEDSFKKLTNNSPTIIHIATHGFYFTQEEFIESKIYEIFHNSIGGDMINIDLSLNRSGLLFSGATDYIQTRLNPFGKDDGILTSYEISQLDLSMTDLVVLSACNTGLGERTPDGIAGIQRGLKKAGINSILMSLWEVDDDATQLLMTNFYKNYLNGKSKRESLHAAQKVVRETPGFEDPEYWAAFILLDALN